MLVYYIRIPNNPPARREKIRLLSPEQLTSINIGAQTTAKEEHQSARPCSFAAFFLQNTKNGSGETGTRTRDTMIFSHVLYQLSYLAV